MFLESKNSAGLVYIKISEIATIVPSDVRESKSDTTRLAKGACITIKGGEEYYVLDTPMDLISSIPAFDAES